MNRDKRITVKIASIRTLNTAKAFKMVSNQAVEDALENENTEKSVPNTLICLLLSACFPAENTKQ